MVPIRKPIIAGKPAELWVCGDYSVTVTCNHQLEPQRHSMPSSEDLMRKVGGYGVTKIDLAEAYNQVMLAPERKNA